MSGRCPECTQSHDVDTLKAEVERLKREKGDAEAVLGWAGGSAAGLVPAAHNATATKERAEARVEVLENALRAVLKQAERYGQIAEHRDAEWWERKDERDAARAALEGK